jgi:uncharacterized membrane protein YedE/YeeE
MRLLSFGVFGVLFGILLSRIGFADFGEMHRMHLLADRRMLFVFGGAVALSAAAFAILRPKGFVRRVHRGTILGSVLFGAGWALTGACPATALIQIGAGHVSGVLTSIGIVLGIVIQRRVQSKLRWNSGSCDS